MMNIKQESLREALETSGCMELPKAFTEDGDSFWLDAIVLVRKCNGTQSYCLATHREDGMVQYTQDFGLMSPIFGLVSVHPYIMLDKEKYYPEGDRYEVSRKILSAYDGITMEELDAMSDEKFAQTCLRYAMDAQREDVQRLDESNTYVDDDDELDRSPRIATSESVVGTALKSDSGVLEDFVEISSAATMKPKKRGRKPNSKK